MVQREDLKLIIFGIPKPFEGHIGTIQDNAIASWARIGRVVLYGDEKGVADAAARHGALHVPNTKKNERGTPLLDGVFADAESRGERLCYANCDIIFVPLPSPRTVIDTVEARLSRPYLIVGRRLNLDVGPSPIDFSDGWERRLEVEVTRHGALAPSDAVDYFMYRGTIGTMPPFAVGRAGWDGWMIRNARRNGMTVVDATADVLAVHQNHDHSHLPKGEMINGLWADGAESARNRSLAGGVDKLYTIDDADLIIGGGRWSGNREKYLRTIKRAVIPYVRPMKKLLGKK